MPVYHMYEYLPGLVVGPGGELPQVAQLQQRPRAQAHSVVAGGTPLGWLAACSLAAPAATGAALQSVEDGGCWWGSALLNRFTSCVRGCTGGWEAHNAQDSGQHDGRGLNGTAGWSGSDIQGPRVES